MRVPIPADHYRGYADLAGRYVEGVDYAIHVVHPPSTAAGAVAVIAPHGGGIEGGTSEVARQIAADDHGLYLFEGLRKTGDNFETLHLTSRYFDEPRCLSLIAGCDTVIAVHGYAAHGPDVLLGGRDERLKAKLMRGLSAHGLSCQSNGHRYTGTDPFNVCNRGRSAQGVQLELSSTLRRSREYTALARAVREVLGWAISDVAGLAGASR